MFHYVSTHNFNDLAELCGDDFGIVDLDPEGNNVMIRTRAEWENWFKTLFAQLDAMHAETFTDILDYKALQDGNLGYLVVEFCQHLKTADKHGRFIA